MAEAFPDTSSDGVKLEDEEDSDGWDEMEVAGEQTTCLFCSSQFHTIAVALDHCRTAHDFDLLVLKNKYNMDCYSYIKMINYIRLQKPDPKLLQESSVALWEDECYLKPGDMEPWLVYDFDDLGSAPSTPHYAIDGKAPISNLNFAELQRHIHDLNLQIKQKDLLIESYQKDMDKMKQVTRVIMDSGAEAEDKADSTVGDSADYFNSYAHFGIHYDMLNDKVRTESYKNAILNNAPIFKDKVVLDVGCGTGILSMFCAKAGAASVVGIDQSEVVYKAMDIVRENSLEKTVWLIKGQLEKTTLPVKKVDIIVSEWMGYFLLFEGMLDSVIYAREHYLNEGGILLPNKCTISLTGVSDEDRYKALIHFWDDVYGFSMKCMKPEILQEASIETVPKDKLFTDSAVIKYIDIMTCDTSVCSFEADFVLTAQREATLTALAGYFDTFFDLPNCVEFSTGPHFDRTHWQQTLFYLKDSIDLKEGQSISGTIKCDRLKKNARGLLVTLSLNGSKYDYIID